MRVRHLILTAGLVATLTACGGGGGTGADNETSGQTTAAEETGAAGETAPTVAVAGSDLGQILVDGKGMTVYLFTKDSSGVSNCSGECLAAWPPVPGPVSAGEGVDAALLGTIEATDGTTQATYEGQPLYYFAKDTAAGDVKGQGVNDVWYVLAPDGTAVTATADSGGRGAGY